MASFFLDLFNATLVGCILILRIIYTIVKYYCLGIDGKNTIVQDKPCPMLLLFFFKFSIQLYVYFMTMTIPCILK